MPGFELFGDMERREVQKVLDSGVLMRYGFDGMRNGQWKARELEKALAERMQTRHAQLVSSGTAALTVAMASAGVGAGDEVILPTFTFVASFEAVLALGAVPVLANIDDTLTLNPESVRQAINPRTKVIMPVHMCGSMADLGALSEIAREHNLLLIEDACQAIGGSYAGKPLGSIGDLGCFSFDYVKTITCGEGGALITNNETYYRHADHFSDHGHDHKGSDRGAEGHPFLGYNYRISELNAAVGVAQIKRLDSFLEIQEQNYRILEEAIRDIPTVSLRRVPQSGIQNYSFLNFFMDTGAMARKAHKALLEAGVDGCFYWFDNNWHYHRKWEHLKNQVSLGKLPQEVQDRLSGMEDQDFSLSDQWMGKAISVLIKIGWSENEVTTRASRLQKVLKGL
ncbi:DegT/DnrJ/EryC1/StrS family aminotransferase [Lentiprolixibacter aurantiacus]|uniref:DegT/DnrJ/EryC1/StrS family aminotransferase n=1 Tax=Lentiprolixibacter aurantiacus TaxID=2993939 RepID=A0AAE3SP20_9FLAO|nr:DegT/DnrJ/EryC1/StrS family aminotransferase [Lentiprolixibacter aurantiacus]MCX2719746.1 DegT/DnrJ/EryC1/StrS family aminotransferase [Lentiprolixibacter aurantiacus]